MRHERTVARHSTIMRAAVTATAAVTLAVAVVACGSSTVTTSRSPAPVRIGAIYNLTGSQASLDMPSLDGARLAVDQINAAGGLMGRRVELLERDGHTNPADVSRAAKSLVAENVTAIIGLSDTDQVLAAAPVAARAGIPFVTSGATSAKLTEQVPDWLFLACFGDNAQAAAGAQYARERLKARTAAVIYGTDMDYTRLLARYFIRSFRSQGGRVIVEQAFEGRGRGVTERLAGTRAATADLLFVAAGPYDAGPLVRRLRAAGYRQPIMGGDSFDDDDLIAAARATEGEVYFTTHAALALPSANAGVRGFRACFRAAYGRAPLNAFACLGYDAVNLVAAAVASADSAQPAAVRDALQATRRFNGVSGTLSYPKDQCVPEKQVTIVRVASRPVVVAQFTPGYVPKP